MTTRRRSRKIETPQEFEESIVAYLEEVHYLNSDKLVIYDIMTGNAYDSREDAIAKGVDVKHIKSEWEKVPVYDLVKPTLSGYCAYAGISMQVYYSTADRDDEYRDIDGWFRTLLEAEVEQLLLNPMNRNSGGAKFVAINRHGWSDKTEIEHKGENNLVINWDIDEGE